MKLHEYQARQLLADHGVAVPPAEVIDSADEAAAAFEKLAPQGGGLCVVKAQVHAGGRGKGGGVKLVRSAEEATEAARAILAKPLVTPQTGPEGVEVKKLLVAAGVDIAKEYYLGVVVDRARGCPVIIASAEGGVEIEEVAESNPDAILKEPVDPSAGLLPYQATKLAFALGLERSLVKQFRSILSSLVDAFLASDGSLVEINPLVVTPPSDDFPDGQMLAIDAKADLDDNAAFRQKKIAASIDEAETPESETRAAEHGLSYIQLDGSIGCLVNGAGLAMATMDIIKLHGAEPANFLDVGGSADQEAVTEAFRIILSDPSVKGILVNIFGGIAKCDTIAKAIVAAASEIGFEVPLVVRLEGTNVEPARKILEEAKSQIPTMIVGDHLTDAAEKITGAVAAAA